MRRPPRLYFSFRSPYTWFAATRLLAVLPDAHERIEFIPYWDPDPITEAALGKRGAAFHYTQMSRAKHRYILQDTKRVAQRLGLQIAWPVDVNPCWEVPHLAWLRAQRLGFGASFFAAVMAARWERGDDICQQHVIRRLARSVGADEDALATAASDAGIRAAAVDCLVDAYEDDIFGVPYFRAGPHRFWGFDRLDAFLHVIAPSAGATATASRTDSAETDPLTGISQHVLDRAGGYDTDTAGGCG